MNAGKLDRRITLQRKSMTFNDAGEPVETWHEIATVWAEKVDMRGSERYTAAQTVAQLDTKFRIRYRQQITPIDRVLCYGRVYDVGGILEIGRREGLELHAKARAEEWQHAHRPQAYSLS